MVPFVIPQPWMHSTIHVYVNCIWVHFIIFASLFKTKKIISFFAFNFGHLTTLLGMCSLEVAFLQQMGWHSKWVSASRVRTNKLWNFYSWELVSGCDGDKQFIGRLKICGWCGGGCRFTVGWLEAFSYLVSQVCVHKQL